MFVNGTVEDGARAAWVARQAEGAASYAGRERRSKTQWAMAAFDEIDFGILLLSGDFELIYANRAARSDLAAQHPLSVVDQRVCARDPRDANRLQSALQDAAVRGLRRLLLLSPETALATVAVVPLPGPSAQGPASVMLMLGRRKFADPLAVEVFARGQGLTLAETRVLLGLCNGKAPQQIAGESNVEISTVRSQIVSIRQKTKARNLRNLIAQIAALPPFMGVLGRTFISAHMDSDARASASTA